ncbi:MAG: hypothetical protein KatS3mg087_0013 [Patescibacteria group bacterium]|nr:MAG: hypothetical protein KatS3mg087_0013 [Patescibacteria group bacterium]
MFRTLKLYLLHKRFVGFTAERFIVHTVRKGVMNDAVSTNKAVTIQEKARLCLRWLDEDACLRESAPIWLVDLAGRIKFFRFNLSQNYWESHRILKDILEAIALFGFSTVDDLIKNVLFRKYPHYLYDWLLEERLATSWVYSVYSDTGVTEQELYASYREQLSHAINVVLSVFEDVNENTPFSALCYSVFIE